MHSFGRRLHFLFGEGFVEQELHVPVKGESQFFLGLPEVSGPRLKSGYFEDLDPPQGSNPSSWEGPIADP